MFTIDTKKHQHKHQQLDFIIAGVDVSIVNAIRRVILSEIPNVAVSFDSANTSNTMLNDITFKTNTTNMHNEFLGKRLSLTPLCFDADEIQNYDPTKYLFVIDKTGGNTLSTGDIRILDEHNAPYPDEFVAKIFPVDPITGDHVLLAWLKPETTIQLEFRARKGIAMTHARWCPVSTCTYFNTLDEVKIEAERKLLKIQAAELLKAAKEAADDAAILDAKLKINSNENKFETIDKYRLFKTNKYNEPSSFNFKVDSECRLEPVYLVNSAISILRQKVLAVAQKTKIEVINKETNMFALNVVDEDNTIGNLVQCSVYNNYVRENNQVDFIGYFQPHPLDRNIVFKLRLFKDSTVQDVADFWVVAMQLLAKTLDGMLDEWTSVNKAAVSMVKKAATKTIKTKVKTPVQSSDSSGDESDKSEKSVKTVKTVKPKVVKPRATKASAKKSVQ